MPDQLTIQTKPAKEKNQPRQKWWRFRNLIFVLLILLLLTGLSGFVTFQSVKKHLDSGMAHAQSAIDQLKNTAGSPTNIALTHLREELAAAGSAFKQAREDIGPFGAVLPALGWLPGPAYDLANLNNFLEIAEKVTKIGTITLDGVQPALAYFDKSQASPTGNGSTGKLIAAAQVLNTPATQTNLAEASKLLTEIINQRAGIDSSRLGLAQTRKALDQLDQQLPALKEGLRLLTEVPALLPGILGQDKPVNYLTLLQNSDELRPTGGFISAVGLINLDQGKLSLSSFQDSYAVDNPKVTPAPPPEPLARYMKAGYFLLRDANWWPDFPTSARQIAEIYQQNQERKVDNVIALDSQAVAYIFEALGPLDLPNYNEHLTAQNFEERLRYYYLPPGTATNDDWWLKRKQFIGVVLNGLLNRFNGASVSDYLKLANWLGKALSEKHLQLYFSQPALEAELTHAGLDGRQTETAPSAPANDYLMVVDTNVGFNKVSPRIDRSMSYSVSSAGQGASIFASLTLTYTNHGGVREGTQAGECIKVVKYDSNYESMINGCYWNYLRVYVPAGSVLRQATGFAADSYPVTGSENGKTTFATQLIVPPGETVSVTVDYLLPASFSSKLSAYQLTIQKQAGVKPFPLTVQLNWPGVSGNWAVTLAGDQQFNPETKGGS